jgi:hypothetical protein
VIPSTSALGEVIDGRHEEEAEGAEAEAGAARRRALCLLIARHVVAAAQRRGGDAEAVAEACAFVAESDGLLRIEDVLPLCPDSASVDHFQMLLMVLNQNIKLVSSQILNH